MNPLGSVIEDARKQGVYRCAHCDYPLSDVPLDEQLAIVCPECGYEMVFSVKVQLLPRHPEFDRVTRTRLQKLEQFMLPLSLLILAAVIGSAIVVYAVTR